MSKLIKLCLACALVFAMGLIFTAYAGQIPSKKSGTKKVKNKYVLHKAIEKGDKNLVEQLVAQGANIEQKDPYGRTPLRLAVWHNRENIVAFLIAKGASIHEKHAQGITLLMAAAANGNEKIIKLLLALDPNINEHDQRDGDTALQWAARYGRDKAVALLLAHGANVNEKNKYGETALTIATLTDHKNEKVMVALIINGATVTGTDAIKVALEEKWKEALPLIIYALDEDSMKLLTQNPANMQKLAKLDTALADFLQWYIHGADTTHLQERQACDYVLRVMCMTTGGRPLFGVLITKIKMDTLDAMLTEDLLRWFVYVGDADKVMSLLDYLYNNPYNVISKKMIICLEALVRQCKRNDLQSFIKGKKLQSQKSNHKDVGFSFQ